MYVNILDINECDSDAHNCSIHAKCANIVGGFECKCNSGFTDTLGDGTLCRGKFNVIPIYIYLRQDNSIALAIYYYLSLNNRFGLDMRYFY